MSAQDSSNAPTVPWRPLLVLMAIAAGTTTAVAVGDLPISFVIAWLAYRAKTLWPAVFLHSFHNTISQWLYPKLFESGNLALLDGEGGVLPMAGYVVLGAALFVWMRRRGPSWRALTRDALSSRG